MKNKNKVCVIEGCFEKVFSRNWCRSHYNRWYKYGDPEFIHVPKPKQLSPQMKWLKYQLAMNKDEGCWIWPFFTDEDGYGGGIAFEGKKDIRPHVISLILSGSPRPGRLHCLHSCDNQSCVNPLHLRWGTIAENNQDMKDRGRLNISGLIAWNSRYLM